MVMDITIITFIKVLVAYIVGSIPSGLIIGKGLFGKDLREYGSKNIGSTNAYRVLGIKGALLVFTADTLKGAIGVMLFKPDPMWMVIGGIMAMIGHNWSLFLKFKGGKGVATGLGLLIVLVPKISLIIIAIWVVIVLLTKYVSLGSMIAACSVPVLMYYFNQPIPFLVFGLVSALFVLIRHKANIKRLLDGEELKVKRL